MGNLAARGAPAPSVFRISITELPKNLDPHRSRSSSGLWQLQQLYRNFYVYDDKKSYVPELGESCVKTPRRWECKIKPNLRWSDGSSITSEDFVLSFRRMLTLPHPRASLLFNIENAREVFDSSLGPERLGVRAMGPYTFEIRWLADSVDNEIVLMSPLFVPLPQGKYKADVFSGPYQIADQNNQRVRMSPNSQYFKKNTRPPLEFQVFEENLSVKAFEKKQLDFLRRVPSAQIPLLKKSSDFYWQPVMRFDSVAFGPSLQKDFKLRKQLSENLDYKEWQTLFDSPEKIGCPGLGAELYGKKEICYRGRSAASKSARAAEKSKRQTSPKLSFVYSSQGGDDHRRLAEWIQSQWLKTLNLNVSLQPLENKIFQDLVAKNPPDLFRRGLNLESPTCHNALRNFVTGDADNFINFKNAKFDELVSKLMVATTAAESKQLCAKGLQMLMDAYVMIPTGRINFAYMANREFKGWRLNELFHLDLSELQTNLK